MSYTGAIEYLYGLQKHGMKFGLDNIRRLMSACGNPHQSFRSVHIAGTNGKGSTSAMIEAILRTGGVTTGLFTSPHLVNFTERIRINGKEISEEEVIALAEEVRGLSEKLNDFSPTFFEVVAAMAFLHFSRTKVDWAVVEVGLGGRLDATNVINPEVSVITAIDFDHREFLGTTLKEIAVEKAGIIKEGVPLVTAGQAPEAMDVLERKAAEKGSALFKYGSDFSSELVSSGPEGISFHYKGDRELDSVSIPLSGEYQMINASMAVKTIEILSGSDPGLDLNVKRGLENVRWPGRLEMIKNSPPLLIDGAHNPHAARTLAGHLRKLLAGPYRRMILVLGIMGDKDMDGIMTPLLPLASEVIFTAPAYGRAASPDVLNACAASKGYASRKTVSVADAVEIAEGLYLPGDLIVITGSFYTIGETKEVLGEKGVLSRLRE